MSHQGTHHQDKRGHNNARQEVKDHVLEEEVDLDKLHYVKRGHQEDDHEEPLDQSSEELAGIKVEAGALHDRVCPNRLEHVVELDSPEELGHHFAKDRTHDPADNKDNESNDKLRQECDYPAPDVIERSAQCVY